MTIVENTILHFLVLLSLLVGFGALITGVLRQSHSIYRYGFYAFVVSFLICVFLSVIHNSLRFLSQNVDEALNLVFGSLIIILGVLSVTSIAFYYSRQIIPLIFVKLSLIISITSIVITVTSNLSKPKKRLGQSTSPVKFVESEKYNTEVFSKDLSKQSSSADSILIP
jgi:predicted membrane channel-forming protein YqfA (hemolysin III family)